MSVQNFACSRGRAAGCPRSPEDLASLSARPLAELVVRDLPSAIFVSAIPQGSKVSLSAIPRSKTGVCPRYPEFFRVLFKECSATFGFGVGGTRTPSRGTADASSWKRGLLSLFNSLAGVSRTFSRGIADLSIGASRTDHRGIADRNWM